jgi:hypothetical protein
MNRQLETRLARIEGKINTIARWFVLVLGIAVAYASSYLFREYEWAMYYGIAIGFLAGLAFERGIANLEKRLPNDDENDDRDHDA